MKRIIVFMLFGVACLNVVAKQLGVVCFFSTETVEDEFVKIELREDGSSFGWGLSVLVTNKTDKTIYIDKANSFMVAGGNSLTWFKNSAKTTMNSSNVGVSVNAGSIARAAGVGGALGTALDGINVGSGSQNGTGTTVYEQRVIAIAPHGSMTTYRISGLAHYIDERIMDAGVKTVSSYKAVKPGSFINPLTGEKEKFKKKKMRHYEKSGTPLALQTIVKYSLSEGFETSRSITLEDYVTDVYIVSRYTVGSEMQGGKPLKLRQFHPNKLCYMFWSGSYKMLGVPFDPIG